MTNKINGIDVSKYFIEVVDEGGSTINYKILPNIEILLVERIFEQNQQLKHLQEENEEQKEQIKQLEDFVKSDGEIDHINHEYTYKLQKVLQEVKSIVKGIRSYLEIPTPRDVRFEMDRILDLTTEAELPDQKEDEEE